MKNDIKKNGKTFSEETRKIAEEAYKKCVEKFGIYMENYKGTPYDVDASIDGNYLNNCFKNPFKNSDCWTASMITGLAPLYYRTEKNTALLDWADKFYEHYSDKIYDNPTLDTMHDLGFLYSPYCVAMYQITGDKKYRDVALKAADELAKRFHIKTGCIDAWGNMTFQYVKRPVRIIIDTLMNLPLLLWAWMETNHSFYVDVVESHINIVKKYLLREDGSVAHQFIFDRKTGEVIGENNSCGFANGSWWARGTAWAIYGLAIVARYLNRRCEFRYLSGEYHSIAEKLVDNYINALGEGKYVPIWDFRLPKDTPAKSCGSVPPWDETKIENCKYNVDSSACALVACGILELSKLKENKKHIEFMENSINVLCREYFNDDTNIPGILKMQTGNGWYSLFGDYYFVEALQVYLNDTQTCW